MSGRAHWKSCGVVLALLLVLTIWIRLSTADLAVARSFFDTAEGWKFAHHPALRTVYNLGVLPAILVGIGALGVLLAGIGQERLVKYRKVSAYLVLCLALGAGVVTNLVLKNNWGRPRPSQLAEFGGSFSFEPVVWMDFASSGKSFPCGHATMGFFFFAVALVLPAAWKWRRYAVGGFGFLLGGALGFARIAQGGHFLSDVIWAAAVMWFVSLGLFHAMGLQKSRLYVPREGFKKVPAIVNWACLPILFLGMFAAALGTPYERKNEVYGIGHHLDGGVPLYLKVEAEGDVVFLKGDELMVDSEAEGFGLPKSSLKYRLSEEDGVLIVRSMRKGFFTELRSKLIVTLPRSGEVTFLNEGELPDLRTVGVDEAEPLLAVD
ncbi:phosphatase PAP2 family protein [Luteolibacter sp. AS25]|uniref:phosphatase PAP2 family protein n=1 Tax=Luteolibacter sp. AS25 TaxID=3135776 RepID=UPI00398B66BB